MEHTKILIVEDEFIVAKDLQAYLEKLGYTVCGHVNSGEKAIQHLQSTPTDIVLMDIMLKGDMTGIEAAGEIREHFRLPVIYVTANTNPGIVAQAKITEPFCFIVKPFNERELHANIEMSLYKHRMERELANQKALLDEVFSGVQEGIALLDEYLNVVFCNPAYADLVGVPKYELQGKNAFLFFDNESRSLLVQKMKKRCEGQHSAYELPLITMKGIEKYVRVTVTPRFSSEGTVIGEFVTMLDITARKKAEEEVRRHRDHLGELVEQRTTELQQEIIEREQAEYALQESEKKFRELTELLPQAVFEIDLQGNFTYTNRWGLESTGYTPEDIERGFDVFHFTIPEDHERLKHNIARILNGAPVEPHEYTMIRKDGSIFPALVYSAPILRNQQPVGLRGIGIDITERKHLEEQLLQSQKMEAVGQLAGGIAHDFNTLLGIILGHGEIIRDDLPEGSPLRDNLEEIIEAGYRAKTLVKQLLDFARPSEEDRHPIRLASLVEESSRLLRSSLPTTITIRQHIEAESSVVLANATQIAQVIINLGMNAGDAIGEQGGDIEIVLENIDVNAKLANLQGVRQGTYIRLSISDTGCGMSHDVLEHIFEPFFTTKEVGEGSGLGLSIVHGIVNSYGGFITVESMPGKGSSFQVYLPMIA